jgi:hypothetical protein
MKLTSPYSTKSVRVQSQSEHGGNNKRRREADRTHDVPLVELALEVVDNVGAGCEVGRHEDVGPVPRPPGVVLVVVRRRPDPLQPLRISRGAACARVRLPSHVRSWILGTGRERDDDDDLTAAEISDDGKIFFPFDLMLAVVLWGPLSQGGC